MKVYEVQYKKVNSLFWKKLKNVKGDGFVEIQTSKETRDVKDIRWFILEDESRIEIPAHNYIFKFDKDRFYLIKFRMESETGTDLKLNKR